MTMNQHRRHRSEQIAPSSSQSSFASIIHKLERKKQKIYHEGQLQRREDMKLDGSPASDIFASFYARLQGTSLLLWAVETPPDATQAPSSYLNLADARLLQSADHASVIVSTAGRNRFTFRPQSKDSADCDTWYVAFRLAAFERARLQEVYTARLIKYFSKDWVDATRKDSPNFEDHVDVRITSAASVQAQWTRMYCHLFVLQKSGLFRRRHSRSTSGSHLPVDVRDTVELHLYGNQKDKRPQFILTNAFAAYALYPEHSSLIETATMVKIEGCVHVVTEEGQVGSGIDGNIMMLLSTDKQNKRKSLSPSTDDAPVKALLKLTYSLWVAFGLYGKPEVLHLDVDHVNALGSRSDEAADLHVLQIMASAKLDLAMSTRQWRSFLREQSVLSAHYRDLQGPSLQLPLVAPLSDSVNKSQLPRGGHSRRIASESAIKYPPQPLVTSIEEDQMIEQARLAPPSPNSRASRSSSSLRTLADGERTLRVPVENGGRQRFVSSDYSPTLSSPTVTGWSPRAPFSSNKSDSPLVTPSGWPADDDASAMGSTEHLSPAEAIFSRGTTAKEASPALYAVRDNASQYSESYPDARDTQRFPAPQEGSSQSRRDGVISLSKNEAPEPRDQNTISVPLASQETGNLRDFESLSRPSATYYGSLDPDALGLVRRRTQLMRTESYNTGASVASRMTDGDGSVYSEVPERRPDSADGDSQDATSSAYASTHDDKESFEAPDEDEAFLESRRKEALRQLSIHRALR